MEKFTVLRAVAAPMPRDNVDTDAIIPTPYVLRAIYSDYSEGLFAYWRYGEGRTPNPDFVLNQPRYQKAGILLAGMNFGCGSAREHAVWALMGFGIRSVIAPSFGDIFRESSYKNGLLPVVLPHDTVRRLIAAVEAAGAGAEVTVDLENRRVVGPDNSVASFEIEEDRHSMLLEGLDEIGLTLRDGAEITEYQRSDRERRPWIYRGFLPT
jgi:3-isopropylmalate/(R)-2-methylmalate dehydratase small subunit